jgi:hypothetical protein
MSLQGLTVQEKVTIQKSMYRAVDLIQNYFTDPKDKRKNVVLDKHQIDFIDCIQFGFALSQFKFSDFKNKKPPKGVITIWRRQVGKSYSCAWAVAALMIIDAPCAVGIVAASETEAQLLIDKVKDVIDKSPFRKFIEGRPRLDILKLKNGSYVRSHTCSETNIRGPSYDIILIDESALMNEAILFGAALPTVTHGKRWVAITTPKGKRGKLVEFYLKGIESRPIVCKKCSTEYKQKDFDVEFPYPKFLELPILPDCKVCGGNDYKYGMGYFAIPYLNPWECSLIDPEELKALMDLHDWSPLARQEYLGELIEEASMVILKEWIDKNTNKELRNIMKKEDGVSYVAGIDYGRKRDAASICITHKHKKTGRIVLDYMRTISGEFDYETDWASIKKQFLEVLKYYNPVWVVPDATGLGDPLVEELKRDLHWAKLRSKLYNNTKNGLGFNISHKSKPELIGYMIALFSRNPQALELPPASEPEIRELVSELLRFECEIQEGGYIKYGTQQYHDDRVISLALSLWGNRRLAWYNPTAAFFDYDVSKVGKSKVKGLQFNLDEYNDEIIPMGAGL